MSSTHYFIRPYSLCVAVAIALTGTVLPTHVLPTQDISVATQWLGVSRDTDHSETLQGNDGNSCLDVNHVLAPRYRTIDFFSYIFLLYHTVHILNAKYHTCLLSHLSKQALHNSYQDHLRDSTPQKKPEED